MSATNGTNGATNGTKEKVDYTKVPGPLGLESASLKGKVALVTGSGMHSLLSHLTSIHSNTTNQVVVSVPKWPVSSVAAAQKSS